jgi:ribonuclease H2 subunit A
MRTYDERTASICGALWHVRVYVTGTWQTRGTYACRYPGDPITKKWFATAQDKVFGYPTLVRFSWATAKKAIAENCVAATWEDDGDSDDDGSTPSVMSFFVKKDGR